MDGVTDLGGEVYEIDTLMGGHAGITAGYLIRSDRPCLVETGTALSAPTVIESLESLGIGPGDLATVVPDSPECALVVRDGLDIEVLKVPRATGVFIASLKRGETLGSAAAAALAVDPDFDAALPLALLIQKGVITALHSSRRTS